MNKTVCVLFLLLLGCPSQPSKGDSEAAINLTGTWTGALSAPDAESVTLRYVITDDNGQLSGEVFDQDPATGEWLRGGNIIGTRNGTEVSWKSDHEVVTARLEGNALVGKYSSSLGAEGPDPQPIEAHLVLRK